MVKVPGRVYRIVEAIEDRWHVSEFESYRLMSPEVSYSWEALPDWIKINIAMLKMAIPENFTTNQIISGTRVNGLGARIGNTFWINDGT